MGVAKPFVAGLIELAGAGVVGLSFMTWIRANLDVAYYGELGFLNEFQPGTLANFWYRGDDVHAITDVGDGWITAGLGLTIVIASILSRFTDSQLWMSLVTLAAALIVALMVYILADGWPGQFPDGLRRPITYTWQFWGVLSLSVLSGILGFWMLLEQPGHSQEAGEFEWA